MDIIKWIAGWRSGSCLSRAIKSITLIFALGSVVAGFAVYFIDIARGANVIFQNAGYWMRGDMNWINDNNMMLVVATVIFVIACLIIFGYVVFTIVTKALYKVDKENEAQKLAKELKTYFDITERAIGELRQEDIKINATIKELNDKIK